MSTRKVKRITEELCGHALSASVISSIVKRLDAQLQAFARRRLSEPFPYLIVDARYEKVRENGIITAQAVRIALGIDWEGRRQGKYAKLTDWVEDNIEVTFAFYRLPRQHQKHLK